MIWLDLTWFHMIWHDLAIENWVPMSLWGCQSRKQPWVLQLDRCLSPSEAWSCARWLQTLVGCFKYVFDTVFPVLHPKKNKRFQGFFYAPSPNNWIWLLFCLISEKQDHAHHYVLCFFLLVADPLPRLGWLPNPVPAWPCSSKLLFYLSVKPWHSRVFLAHRLSC